MNLDFRPFSQTLSFVVDHNFEGQQTLIIRYIQLEICTKGEGYYANYSINVKGNEKKF